jgi:F420-0:gamma-glutamyl ligase
MSQSPYQTPSLQVFPITTSTFRQGQDLLDFIIKHLNPSLIREEAVLAITSKIVSIAENATVRKLTKDGTPEHKQEKQALVKKEADEFLGETLFGVSLTVKHGLLIPTAGIDESNSSEANYILFPKDPYQSARSLWLQLKKHYQLKKFGLILTDSHTTPLRKGVTGIGLAHAGFKATRDLIGSPDLFGRVMKMTQVNVLDALSASAVYEMGETNDSCPLAILYARGIEFTEESTKEEIQIPLKDDLYGSLFL